jgi:hypothetical protein
VPQAESEIKQKQKQKQTWRVQLVLGFPEYSVYLLVVRWPPSAFSLSSLFHNVSLRRQIVLHFLTEASGFLIPKARRTRWLDVSTQLDLVECKLHG